jgi:hypothetical protein
VQPQQSSLCPAQIERRKRGRPRKDALGVSTQLSAKKMKLEPQDEVAVWPNITKSATARPSRIVSMKPTEGLQQPKRGRPRKDAIRAFPQVSPAHPSAKAQDAGIETTQNSIWDTFAGKNKNRTVSIRLADLVHLFRQIAATSDSSKL